MSIVKNNFCGFEQTRIINRNHTPYNKRAGEVSSTSIVEIHGRLANENVDESVSVHFEEVTTSPNGRVASRVISLTFRGDELAALRDAINNPRRAQ